MKLRHTETKEEFEPRYAQALEGDSNSDVHVYDRHGELRVFQRKVLEEVKPVKTWEDAPRGGLCIENDAVTKSFSPIVHGDVLITLPDGFRLYWDGTRAVLQRRVG